MDMCFLTSVELCSILLLFLGCILITINMSSSNGQTLLDFVLPSISLSKVGVREEISTSSVLQVSERRGSPEMDRTFVLCVLGVLLLSDGIPVPMNRSHFILAEPWI